MTVSIVIPCYNHGKYIDRAVDSILGQTFADVEIIVVNDGSTDQFTVKKLNNYKKAKTKILHTVNQGPSAARNIGISQAKGEYILVLDADDHYHSTFLEKGIAVFEQDHKIGIVACGIQHFGLDSGKKMPKGGDVRAFLAPSGLTGSALLRKVCWEQAGGYDESMKTSGYEDWNFWIDVTKRGWLVHIIEEYLFYYNWQDDSRRTMLNSQRAASLSHVVRNHRDVFGQYVDLVILNKDKEVMAMKGQRDALASSLEYRLGCRLLQPLRFFQKFFGMDASVHDNA
jgi:hypothetical protein